MSDNKMVLVPEENELAQFIRETDGNHEMGAGLLAYAIVRWLAARPQVDAAPAAPDLVGLLRETAKRVGHPHSCAWWDNGTCNCGVSDLHDRIDTALRGAATKDEKQDRDRDGSSSDAAGVIMAWQPILTAPKGHSVLLHYQNSAGKGRTIKAIFIPRYTEEASGDGDEDCSEYCEERDNYYCLEGWYEQIDNWGDFAQVFVHEKPTHWMPLPSAPSAAGGEGKL